MPDLHKVLICGKTGVGKTTAAQMFHEHGWLYVSAGQIVRELCSQYVPKPTTNDLMKFGLALLNGDGIKDFHEALYDSGKSSRYIVYDGIRLLKTVRLFRKETRGSKILFITCPDEIIVARLVLRCEVSRVEAFDRVNHSLELHSAMIESIADVVISNDRDIVHFRDEVRTICLNLNRG